MFTILCICLFVTLFYASIKKLTFWSENGTAQENLRDALIFNFFGFFRRISLPNFMTEMYQKFPGHRYYGSYLFNTPILVLKDVNLLKEMVIKDYEHFNAHRDFVPTTVDPLFGKALFFIKGNKWRHIKSTLSPSFTGSRLKALFPIMTDISQRFVNNFVNKNEKIVEIDMKDTSSRFSTDVVTTTCFGVAVDSFKHPDNKVYAYAKEMTDFTQPASFFRLAICFTMPSIAKIFDIKLVSHKAYQFFSKLIEDTLKLREEKGIVRPDMIHLLMEATKVNNEANKEGLANEPSTVGAHLKGSTDLKIMKEDIMAQAFNYFFAGFDSVSVLMSYMAFELCAIPDIQARLRAEIEETLENCDGKITYEALLTMKYMDMVVTETLRKWPPQTSIERICTKPYTIQPSLPNEKTVHLNPGQSVFLPILGIQRDPDHFPDPDTFDPERFSDENKANVKAGTFLTFGIGSRVCIGSRFTTLETKLFFFFLLRNFKIVPVGKTKIPFELTKTPFSNLPAGGFWMGLERI